MAERDYANDYDDWLRDTGGDMGYGGTIPTQPQGQPYVEPNLYGDPNSPTYVAPAPTTPARSGFYWQWDPVARQWVETANGAPPSGVQLPTSEPTPTAPTGGGGGYDGGYYGGGYSGGGFPALGSSGPSFSAPSFMDPGSFSPGPAFSYRDFVAPDPNNLASDKGFQFRLDQGRKALEASAAGKGILRSGGTLKDLLGYGQNFASQEYGNVWNRALQEYDTNRRNAWDTWSSGYQGRKDQYAFGADRANAINAFNQNNAQFDWRSQFDKWAKEGDWMIGLADGDYE